jgi:sulfoxide reductase heme-binding subunit YedZ
MAGRDSRRRWITTGVCVASAIPALVLLHDFLRDELGANPVEAASHATGQWTLRLLLLTLCISPARRITGASWLAPERRTLGLCAFSYGCLHFAIYLVLDLDFDLSFLGEDLRERPYITLGFTGFVLMIPLALTSNRFSIRRLRRRWNTLHRLVYASAIAGVLHFIWLVKADLREPLIYAGLLALLLALRAPALRSLISPGRAPRSVRRDRATDHRG